MRLKDFGRPNRLYCFSPPVMIATVVIELVIAGYVLLKYKMSPMIRTAVIILACLAIFQLAEFQICARQGTAFWSKLGFASISLLPPLGLFLQAQTVRNVPRWLTIISAISAVGVVATIVLNPSSINAPVCTGNYVIFGLFRPFDKLFGFYYFVLLFAGIFLALRTLLHDPQKKWLIWLIIGYLSFMLPAMMAILIFPSAADGLPSVMCGFAVIFALVLGLRVVPSFAESKKLN